MTFVAAKPNPFITGLTRQLLPAIPRARGLVAVECLGEDLDRLRTLRGERVLLAPNHPTALDPAVTYHPGKLANQPFCCVCAREVFDQWCGLWGWPTRRCGAYSVVRRIPEGQSLKATREPLSRRVELRSRTTHCSPRRRGRSTRTCR